MTETLDPFANTSGEAFVRACLKEFLENPNLREKLGISSEARSEILRDPKAIGQLSGVAATVICGTAIALCGGGNAANQGGILCQARAP